MGKRFLAAGVGLVLASGCGTAMPTSSDRVAPRDTQTPTPAPAGMTQYWLRGVGVDAPSSWKPNKAQCGTPMADTVIVMYAGEATASCAILSPPKHLSVIQMTSGNNNADYLRYDWHPATINGASVEVANTHTDDGDHERFVQFTDRQVTVDITSPDVSVVDDATNSLQVVDTDPATGCVVHTNAYDDGKPSPQGDSHYLLPGHPTSAIGCVYVSGWLETSARVTGDRLTALVDAVQAAPELTDSQAPDDTNCDSVAGMQDPSDNPPMMLRFDYADSSTWTLVAKISWCTRWQSAISSGDVTRRIDQRLLLALPDLWMSYPDPDSMDP